MDLVLATVTGAFSTVAGASFGLLVLAMGLHLGKVAAEARAWHGIVRHAHPNDRVTFGTTLGAFAGATGANAVLPARIGEALKLGITRRRVPGSTVPTVAGTIVLATVIDMAFAVAVVLVVLLSGRSVGHVGRPVTLVHSQSLAAVVIGVGLLAVGIAGFRFRRRLARTGVAVARGMSILRTPRHLFRVVLGWKALAWTLRLAAVYCFLLAFHLGGGLWVVLLVVAAQDLAGLVPLSPGSAGTQQAALAVALGATVGTSAIIGFGVGMQVATGLTDVAAGVVAVVLVSSWSDLRILLRRPSARGLASA
jgi:uncharacterized membrane protein YbhN (UPF0104 family)